MSPHGCNDIVIDGRGNAYVNGAGFNPMAGEEFRPGSVHLVTADGSVRQVAEVLDLIRRLRDAGIWVVGLDDAPRQRQRRHAA